MRYQRKHDDLKVTLTHYGADGQVRGQVEDCGDALHRLVTMSKEEFARFIAEVERKRKAEKDDDSR